MTSNTPPRPARVHFFSSNITVNWLLAGLGNMGQAQSPRDVKTILHQILSEFQLTEWIIGFKTPTPLIGSPSFVLSTFPLLWLTEYTMKAFIQDDPLLTHAQTQNLPLIWESDRGWENHPVKIKKFMDTVRRRGWHCGICFPVHCADGTRGSFNIALREPLTSARPRLEEFSPYGTFIGLHTYEAAKRIGTCITSQPSPRVSPREIECLLWASEGKTAGEIGTILGITERTVTHHIQESVHKLGVKNRQQAIARAIALSLLQPQVGAEEIMNNSDLDDSWN